MPIVFICFSAGQNFRKGGQIINAKITEIGTDEIKYKIFEEPDGPAYVIEKDKI